jgi:hypothetical protein
MDPTYFFVIFAQGFAILGGLAVVGTVIGSVLSRVIRMRASNRPSVRGGHPLGQPSEG